MSIKAAFGSGTIKLSNNAYNEISLYIIDYSQLKQTTNLGTYLPTYIFTCFKNK